MNHPLAGFPITSTRDAAEAQAVLSREFLDVRINKIRDPRAFHMEMSGVHLDQTMVAYNQFDTETLVDPGEVGESVFLVLGIGTPATIHLDGDPLVSTKKGAILSPSRRVVLDLPAGSGTLTVKAKFDAIEKRFQEMMYRRPGKPIVFDPSVDLENGVGAQARRLLESFVDTIEQDSTVLENPVLRAGFNEMLLNILLALPNNYSDELMGNHQRSVAPALVYKMEEFIEAHATEPVTVSDLVAQCECSRAALFNAFRRFRGYTPMQFLAECRLRSAREALQSSSPADTVAAIAYACGFSHPGRFSVAYRRRFGESPSATLHRSSDMSHAN
jgi:AraC-like DNA-binding protein